VVDRARGHVRRARADGAVSPDHAPCHGRTIQLEREPAVDRCPPTVVNLDRKGATGAVEIAADAVPHPGDHGQAGRCNDVAGNPSKVVASPAVDADFAFGTLPSVDSLICLPVRVFFFSFLPEIVWFLIDFPLIRWIAC
jgi:hypothetical protein